MGEVLAADFKALMASRRSRGGREELEMGLFFDYLAWQAKANPIHNLPFHIPNAGKLTKIGHYRRMTGVKPGIPDVCIPIPRGEFHGAYFEFKVKPNTVTEAQMNSLKALTEEGYYCSVVWSGEEAIEKYKAYMGLLPSPFLAIY